MLYNLFRHIAPITLTALVVTIGVLSSVGAVFAVEVDITDNEMKLRGIESTRIGVTLDISGDVNGDGYVDLLIGFYDNTTTTDEAALFYGSSEGFNVTPNIVDADATFHGIASEGNSGGLVSFAGDVNGDGYDDMLIANSFANSATGDVFLIYGSATQYDGEYTLTSMSDSVMDRFQGETTANYAGISLAGVGDMNNDGYDDFAIGAHWNASKAGAAYLFYGSASTRTGTTNLSSADAKFSGEAINNLAGSTISSGDINGDGYSDIIIEASQYDSYRGRVYIIYGTAAELTSINLSAADTIITGEEQYDSIGATTVVTGDINGDGYDDLVIGAQEQSTTTNATAGGAYVIFGESAKLASMNASAADSKITISGSDGSYAFNSFPAADLNNDGYDDVIIGAPNTTNGTVYVTYGAATLDATIAAATEADVIIDGEDSGDTFGQAGGTALINGDGFYDLMISAPQENSIASGAGAIYQINLFEDNDNDGVAGTDGPLDGTDCNDADATVTENQTYYQDSDGDGFGNAAITTSVCSTTSPTGYVANNSDTDDTALGPIGSVVVDNGVLTITYESTYSQEVTPFAAGTVLQAAVSSDALRIVVTNGKSVRILFEGEQVSAKTLYTKKSKKIAKSKLKVTDFYTNYDSIIYISVRDKHGRVAVLRLTDANTLKKLKKKSVDLLTKNPNRQRLTLKPNKKRFISSFGNGSKKVTNTWKVRSNGKVKQVN